MTTKRNRKKQTEEWLHFLFNPFWEFWKFKRLRADADRASDFSNVKPDLVEPAKEVFIAEAPKSQIESKLKFRK